MKFLGPPSVPPKKRRMRTEMCRMSNRRSAFVIRITNKLYGVQGAGAGAGYICRECMTSCFFFSFRFVRLSLCEY